MSTVVLRLGDMFDHPADLIVLPCSTAGTVTSFVRDRLARYRLPKPEFMAPGAVSVQPFEDGENIAQYVGFAASVDGYSSTPQVIRRIATRLGEITMELPAVRMVSVPLLGTGAGGLTPRQVVDALRAGFHSTADRDATLTLSILEESVLNSLRDEARPTEYRRSRTPVADDREPTAPPLRVFVSYSHSSPDHADWVKSFSTTLRTNGIDARLDAWHLRPGMDLPQFMANELSLADRVILVCDEQYAAKADGRVGGVGWETMLIQGDMYRLPHDARKYVAVVRSKSVDEGLPMYLGSKFVLHWPGDAINPNLREKLLRELYDRIEVPPIGTPPSFAV
jgi:hypothetical protein